MSKTHKKVEIKYYYLCKSNFSEKKINVNKLNIIERKET